MSPSGKVWGVELRKFSSALACKESWVCGKISFTKFSKPANRINRAGFLSPDKSTGRRACAARTMNSIVQGLWIGSDLSTMEHLSISSFLQNGHEYHLYIYDHVGNVPEGTVVKDAAEILPAS